MRAFDNMKRVAKKQPDKCCYKTMLRVCEAAGFAKEVGWGGVESIWGGLGWGGVGWIRLGVGWARVVWCGVHCVCLR